MARDTGKHGGSASPCTVSGARCKDKVEIERPSLNRRGLRVLQVELVKVTLKEDSVILKIKIKLNV